MKILTRYILKQFLGPFVLSLIFFAVLVLIVRVFDDIRLIMEFKPGLWVSFKYFVLQVPALTIMALPLAVLMAVLFSLSQLSKNSELIAMRAGGVSIFLVANPLFVAGLVICGLSILFNEAVVPKAVEMDRHTKLVEIQKQAEPTLNLRRQNISMIGAGGQIYHIGSFDGSTKSMTDILILDFGGGNHLKSRVDAKKAQWEDNQWVFYDGYIRAFNDSDTEISARPFDRMAISIPEKPQDFLKEQKNPEDLNLLELAAYILQLKHNGSDYHKEMVEFQYKLAVPFGCVILAVLGIPWGWSMGKYSGVALSFGICLLVAFVYLGGLQIGHQLGYSGVLSPFLSMWIMNIIFAILGPILLIRKNR